MDWSFLEALERIVDLERELADARDNIARLEALVGSRAEERARQIAQGRGLQPRRAESVDRSGRVQH